MWAPFAELFHIHPADFSRFAYAEFCALERRAQQLLNRPGTEDDDG